MKDAGQNAQPPHDDKPLHIFIDNKKYDVTQDSLTPRALLALSGDTSADVVLAVREQGQLRKLTDLDEVISLKNGLHFVVMQLGPTPVS